MSLPAGLEIKLFVPTLLMPVIGVVLVGLIIAGVMMARRLALRWQRLEDELRAAQARPVWPDANQSETSQTADAYRHFIRNASHEIANPLQSIQTNLDNMARCTVEDADRWRHYLEVISTEVGRLMTLTESLRLLAQLETPNAPLLREPVNLKAVIEGVIMARFELAETRRVRLRYVGPERPPRVLGDRDRLNQVLLNLADNGIKYAKPGGGTVIFSLEEAGDRLWVRVSDDGIGIAPEHLQHIGEEAYRAPDARSFLRKGSGLGMPIVKRIVEQHGGTLRIQSQVGEGTTVAFDLPIYSPQGPSEQPGGGSNGRPEGRTESR